MVRFGLNAPEIDVNAAGIGPGKILGGLRVGTPPRSLAS
jgi:hypothetical protein